MTTVITGSTRSDQVLQAGLVLDMEAQLKWLDESAFMFESLSRRMRGGVITATRTKHSFRERRLMPDVVTTTALEASGQTSLSVTNPEYFHRDELIYCPATDEAFLMNEDIGGTAVAGAIAVINIAGSGGITNEIPNGSVLVNLGEVHAEGEAIPPAFAVIDEEVYSYLGQHDRTNQTTDIQNAEEHYGMKEIDKKRKQFWIEYARARNLMLYMGQQFLETTSAGGPRRQNMKGLIEWLAGRKIDASAIQGGVTMKTLGLIVRPTKEYTASSTKKVATCGQNAWNTISSFPDTAVRVAPGEMQKWGVTLKELATAFGNILIGYDQVLNDTHGLADRMFILDPKYVGQLEMQNLPLRMRLNVQNSTDIHNIVDVISGMRGLQVKLPELHAHVYGIS